MSDNLAGLVYDLPEAEYHARPELSQSQMKVLLDSPAKYRWQLDNPQPHKDVFDVGTAFHTLVLGVGAELATFPGKDRRGKGWAEFDLTARARGQVPLPEPEALRVKAMREAVMRHPAARVILERPGASEVSAFWTDPDTGVDCRGRFDKVTDLADGRPVLVDVKTAADASPAGFGKAVWNFRYHLQEQAYRSGHEVITGQDPLFLFIVVEKEPPYLSAVYHLDHNAQARGFNLYRDALDLFVACAAADEWPGFGDDIQELPSPRWAA